MYFLNCTFGKHQIPFFYQILKLPEMTKKKILIPTKDAESWKDLLADPTKQWKDGYSAKQTAYSWEKNSDIPKEILKVLTCYPDFSDLELIFAVPEFKVTLPGGTRPSQNDVLAICTTSEALAVLTVEGKAKEGFDKTIINWKQHTSDNGVKERLGFILSKIGIKDENIDNLRYQLFHRLASATIMAEKFHAKNAIMIVQSFVDDDNQNHFSDFKNFMKCYTDSSIKKSKLYKLTEIIGINIYAAWVFSDVTLDS